MLITVRACSIDWYDHGVQVTTPSRTVSPSIPVNVPTPYTRVGQCDDASWVSVSVLVSLMSNNDNDNDTLREVPHPSNEGLALQARVSGPWSHKKESVLLVELAHWQGAQVQTVKRQNVVQRHLK